MIVVRGRFAYFVRSVAFPVSVLLADSSQPLRAEGPPVEVMATPTTSFSYTPIMTQGTDIPGVTVGRNATGQKIMWIGAYCGLSCTWPPGGVTEIDLCAEQTLAQHPSVGWGSTGPAGLAYDNLGFLWVSSYNDQRIYKVRLSDFTLESSFPTPQAAGRPIGGLAFDGTYLWVASEGGLFKIDETGGVVATYPMVGGGGLESADGFLFVVRLDGMVEARDLSFNLLQTYQFPPSVGPPDAHGDLGIDAESGEGYWSRRGLTQIYRMHLIDGLTGSACSPLASFKLKGTVLNSGGDPHAGVNPASASYQLRPDALGEVAVGASLSSSNFRMGGGFVQSFPRPGEINDLNFTDSVTLTWNADLFAAHYHLYRTPAMGPGTGVAPSADCLQPDVSSATTTDAGVPALGLAFFYVATGVNCIRLEGPHGSLGVQCN